MLWSCEKFDGAKTITGIWRCKEITTQGDSRIYNVSIEPFGNNDSTKFIVLNFYNLGMDFETMVELNDSIFTIASSSIQGSGIFHKQSFTIDWNYSIAGDPNVQARFEKP